MRLFPGVPLIAALLTGVTALAPASPAGAAEEAAAHCARQDRLHVPGAEHQETACLRDLTTAGLAGTPYTDMADQAGLAAKGTRNPSGVPGVQIDGYFPDDSRLNTTHG
ncbi:tannase/feruloyl esterase family alpha/beta hydrolase, partial [Streptomyces wedmorensis]